MVLDFLSTWNGIITITIIVGVFIWQFIVFIIIRKEIKVFGTVLPAVNDIEIEYEGRNNVEGLSSPHNNPTWKIIIDSINGYLSNNKGQVSDFHLIKDIVDRNCYIKEEEIQTQMPVPIYLGLMGTMIGILIGVGFFVLGGGLVSLFNVDNGDGAEGVITLLGGVAMAMITSIAGLIFTTLSSIFLKNSKVIIETNKNIFLSWIQAKLLPNLSNDITQTLQKLTDNLSNFNKDFYSNTKEFKGALSVVTTSAQDLSEILGAINNLKITQIASANIKVYDKLKNCTDEIGKLGEYLQGINQYQANTTDTIELMHKYFASGIEQIDSISMGVKNALEHFANNTSTYTTNLQESTDKQVLNLRNAFDRQYDSMQQHINDSSSQLKNGVISNQEILKKHFETISDQMLTAANNQQEIFKQKLEETTALVSELKQISNVKSSLIDLVKVTNEQKKELSTLNLRIQELAQIKSTGGEIKVTQEVPIYIKATLLVAGNIISLAGFIYLLPHFIKWLNLLFK